MGGVKREHPELAISQNGLTSLRLESPILVARLSRDRWQRLSIRYQDRCAGRRRAMLDSLVQIREPVVWNHQEHVIFHIVIHVTVGA